MTEKNMEMMKKIIEAKQKKSSEQGSALRPKKRIGESRGARSSNKQGGQFDK